MLPDSRFTSTLESGDMLPPDADRARLVRKLDELQSHVADAWDASAKRQQQVRRRLVQPPGVLGDPGTLTGAQPSNPQSIQNNRPSTGTYRAGQADEILSGSPVSIPRRSLLEQLSQLIRRR